MKKRIRTWKKLVIANPASPNRSPPNFARYHMSIETQMAIWALSAATSNKSQPAAPDHAEQQLSAITATSNNSLKKRNTDANKTTKHA